MTEKFGHEERLEYLQEYGNFCMACATIQPDVRYFDVPDVGYIAYLSKSHNIPLVGDSVIGLFDPVCGNDGSKEKILQMFKRHFRNPGFFHISEGTADILSEMGYFVNPYGVEVEVPIPEFQIKGDGMRAVKRGVKNGEKKAVKLCELLAPNDNRISEEEKSAKRIWDETIFSEMKEVSDEWKQNKVVSDREVKYIFKSAVFEHEDFVRKFYVYDSENHEMLGFAFYDPIFSGNKIIGYTPSALRYTDNAFPGINYFINVKAMEKFKEENAEFINLGLNTFYNMNPNGRKYSVLLHKGFRYAFENMENLYNFKGLAEHKRQYCKNKDVPTREVQKYIATTNRLPLFKLYVGLSESGII